MSLYPTATSPAGALRFDEHFNPVNRETPRRYARLLVHLGAAVLLVVTADAVAASCGYLLWKAGGPLARTLAYAAGHLLGLALLAVLAVPICRARLGARLEGLLRGLATTRGVAVLLLAVTLLRVGWVLAVPTEPTSDNAVYHGLARNILATGIYDTGNDRAYWPPGYPAFLVVVYRIFGSSLLAAKLANVFLAGLVDVSAWLLVRRHAGTRAAATALLLTAAWPGRNCHVDVLSYDELVVALLLLSMLMMPARDGPGRRGAAPAGDRRRAAWFGAGLLLGLACLVRSTVGVLPLLVCGWLLLQGAGIRAALARTVVYGAGMLIPLVPWAVRNTFVLGTFVPLGTNAGVNFYTSWAPGSDGGYYRPAWLELSAAAGGEETQLSPLGFRLGWEAIRADQPRALGVAAMKQVHYLGSDNWLLPIESYIAAMHGEAAWGTVLKTGLHTLSNAAFLVALCVPMMLWRRVGGLLEAVPLAWLCLMLFASGIVIHTVFQAQARYHLIYLPFWSILLALLIVGGSVRKPRLTD